jgi:uncharacterized protein
MNEITYTDALPVEGYGPGFFRVGGEVHNGAMLLWDKGRADWGGLEDVETVLGLAGSVDVLFVGTGAEIAHLSPILRTSLENAGLGVEVMNSPSACRTYNVLLSEGRRVALAVVAV